MDNNSVQTSFIPKKPIATKAAPRQRGGTGGSIFMLIAWVLFIGALLAGGGVYFYKQTLAQSLVKMNADLSAARNSFEPTLISELQTLDMRIDAAQELIDNHVVLTPLFQSLQESTLKSIQFTQFSYTLPTEVGAPITIRMSGRARDYTSIALQSDELATNRNIHNAIFSNLSLDVPTGLVKFDLAFTVDAELIRYTNNLNEVLQ